MACSTRERGADRGSSAVHRVRELIGHRTEDDPGRPYRFTDAETLIDDFFAEVEHTLRERGIGTTVIAVEEDDS